jgi:hypothetical protein
MYTCEGYWQILLLKPPVVSTCVKAIGRNLQPGLQHTLPHVLLYLLRDGVNLKI